MMAMPPPAPAPIQLARDLMVALSFSTRLPVLHTAPVSGADVARASWALPIAGAVVGAIGSFVYWVATLAALPSLPAAAIAVAATVLATGALHEDGLADVADGFGGGATRERKLEIMRDSRLGTYGACALVLSLLLRISAIADITQPALVASALLAAHIGARAAMPAVMWFVPPAKPDGLSASASLPPAASVAIAAVLGAIALGLGLGPGPGTIAVLVSLAGAALVARLSIAQIGGQTGDVLGTVEQVSEILILLVAARI
jgi:adenosylcobinamide-GDP ribazoletransferase